MNIFIRKAQDAFVFGLQQAEKGTRLAKRDPRGNKYWGDVRIRGAGQALIQGYAPKATVFGTRPEVILMSRLIHEYTWDQAQMEFKIDTVITHDSTRGTVQNMAAALKRYGLKPEEVHFITHRYHCERAGLTLRKEAGVHADPTPAELFIAKEIGEYRDFAKWWKATYFEGGTAEFYKRRRAERRGTRLLEENNYQYIPKP